MGRLTGITTVVMLAALSVTPTAVFAHDDADSSKVLDSLIDAAISNADSNGVLIDKADSLRFKNPHPTTQDTADFVAIYRQLAGGLPWAAYEMGEACLLGWAMPIDTVQAATWYLKSADMGDIRGMRSAGIIYLAGIGKTPDTVAGLNWLAKASEGGNTEAAAYLGELYFLGNKYTTQNDSLALQYLYMASDSGNIESQKHIADIYFDLESPYSNDSMAAVWANYLAAKGDPLYEYRLGVCYVTHIGLDSNVDKGGISFYQAAAQSYAPAEYELGYLCYLGQGTKVDYVQSYAWAKLAVQHGDSNVAWVANQLIDTLALVMTPSQVDSGKTVVADWHPFTKADAEYEAVLKMRDEQVKAGKTRPGATKQAATKAPDSSATTTTTPTKSRRPR